MNAGRRRGAVTVVAVAYTIAMAGTTLPTPLYPALQSEFGLSTAASTQLFAVYAVTVLTGLIVAGSLSDRVGRKPVLIAALLAAVASGAVYASAFDAPMLFAGRILSGISAALVSGTATAYLGDAASEPRRGAAIATAANMLGLGAGPILAAAIAAATPSWVLAPFAVHSLMAAAACLAVLFAARESLTQRTARSAVVLPVIPREAATAFLSAALSAIGFAVMGACTAITAILVVRSFRITAVLVIGLLGSVIFLFSALGQLVAARAGARGIAWGWVLLVCGAAAIAAGAAFAGPFSVVLYISGVAVVGLGHGALFPRGLERLLDRIRGDARARAASAFWVVAYALTAVSATAVGWLCSLWGDRTGVVVFAAAFAVAAAIAWIIDRAISPALRRDPMAARPREEQRAG